MAKLVVFDMDGVLVDIESSWVHVHRHFRVNNDHSLHAYLRGEIDDLEFIRRDIQLWMDKEPQIDRDRVMDILSSAPIMPGAARTIRELKDAGVKTAIVSAGIDLLAEKVASGLGMDMHLANGFVFDGEGRLSGEGVLNVRLMHKGDSVLEVARRFGVGKRDTVSVGNSSYDVSMFEESGKGIAFCPSDDETREKAHAVVDEKDLSNILPLI
jgi:phosphoserine phosphatase